MRQESLGRWRRLPDCYTRRGVRFRSIAAFLVFLAWPAGLWAQLPKPTNPNLVRLGYYFVNERYGDDTSAVWPYTNLYVAFADGYDTNNPDWQTPFAASLQKATVNHKAIYLGLPSGTPSQPSITVDAVLDIARNYWGQISYVDVMHEPSASFTAQQMEQRIADVSAKIAARGLSPRPYGATFSDAILTTNAILAPSLYFANVEAYVPAPGSTDPQVNVDSLNSLISSAKSRLHNAGKKIVLTMQAYDRSGAWTNMTTLEALQRPVYLSAYADPDVLAILMFSYNRPGGSKDHPVLQQAHREIGSVMGISPAMNVDIPANGSTLTQPFNIAGWAIDRATAGADTGVDVLHVWAFPAYGGSPVFLGVPNYGGYRPDVGAAFGSQFAPSGFGLGVANLPPGWYYIVVYPHSRVSNTFVKEQVLLVQVR